MLPQERLGLARQAYRRALEGARERSTRTSWFRLLTASRNLRSAKEDHERAGARLAGRPAAAPRPGGSTGGASILVLPSARHLLLVERRRELEAEWQRARALREQSRVLVEQARALRADLAQIAWPRPYPVTANG